MSREGSIARLYRAGRRSPRGRRRATTLSTGRDVRAAAREHTPQTRNRRPARWRRPAAANRQSGPAEIAKPSRPIALAARAASTAWPDNLRRHGLPDHAQRGEHGDIHIERAGKCRRHDEAAAAQHADQGGARRRDERKQRRKYQQRHQIERIFGRHLGAVLARRAGDQHQATRRKRGSSGQRRRADRPDNLRLDDQHDSHHPEHRNHRSKRCSTRQRPRIATRLRCPGERHGHRRGRHQRPGKPADQQPLG